MFHCSHVWEKNAEAVAFVGKELVFPFLPSPVCNVPQKVHYIILDYELSVFRRI